MIIKLDHRNIRVEGMEHTGEAYGLYHDFQDLITIDGTASPEQQADTLIHELFHAIWATRNLPARATEEQVCTRLASGLATVLRDNSDLSMWLTQALTKGVPIIGALIKEGE